MTVNVYRDIVGTADHPDDNKPSMGTSRKPQPPTAMEKVPAQFKEYLAACGYPVPLNAEEAAKLIAAEWDALDAHLRDGWNV